MTLLTDDYPFEIYMMKLVSRETIVAGVEKIRGGYRCMNPLLISFLIDPATGLGELHLSKWVPFTEENIVISKTSVMGMVAPTKNLVDTYMSHVLRLQMGPTNSEMEKRLKDDQDRYFEEMLKDFKGPIN